MNSHILTPLWCPKTEIVHNAASKKNRPSASHSLEPDVLPIVAWGFPARIPPNFLSAPIFPLPVEGLSLSPDCLVECKQRSNHEKKWHNHAPQNCKAAHKGICNMHESNG